MSAKRALVEAWLAEEARAAAGEFGASRKFNRAPPLVGFADQDVWAMTAALTWSNPDTQPASVEIPQGFVTDFASIPRVVWPVLPKTGRYGLPAIMHDWLYWSQTIDRRAADRLFHAAMAYMATPAWKRHVIYWTVRAFGGVAWKQNARDRASGDKRVLKSLPDDPLVTWDDWRARPSVFHD